MGLQMVTPPAQEPVSLDLAKAHLRVSGSDEDELIRQYMAAARAKVETFLGRSLITQTLALTLDQFPASSLETIRLPNPPVASVTSVAYTPPEGAAVTMDSALYEVDTASWSPRVGLVDGQSWPATRRTLNAVTITYVAGYGESGDAVPVAIRNEILLLTADLYANRGDMGPVASFAALAASGALWAYRVVEF